jgi:single-strand DNA-binding protein
MAVNNSITLIGRLGRDPELLRTKTDTEFVKFSLATSETYRDSKGDRQTRTQWHEVVAFGKLAEVLFKHLKKGKEVAVSGRLEYNEWTDKNDSKRKTAQVVITEFNFIGSKKEKAATEA